MKKLRLFDSLKLVLATVACVFAIMPAHAATLPAGYTELEYIESTGTQWINTNVNEGTIDYMELKFETVNDSSGFMFVNGASQVGVKDSRYGTSEPGVYIIKQNVLNTKWYFTNETNGTTYTNGRVGASMLYLFNLNNSSGTNYKNKNVKIYYYKASKNDNLVFNAVPARRDSDGVLGMYDLADSNPATAFHTNAGTGTFVAGPVAQIKIATTKYNEESFAPVKTDLSAAVNAVEYVVSNTMSQAQAIDTIATTKQTRPDEGCTAKYCLLVEDEDGTPHWYPIAGANGVAHNLPDGYTELQYIESTGTQYIDTGVYASSNNVEIYLKTQLVGNATQEEDLVSNYGEALSTSTKGRLVIGYYTDYIFAYARNSSTVEGNARVTPTNINDVLEIHAKYDYNNSTKTLTINGISNTTPYTQGVSTDAYTLDLFRQKAGTPTSFFKGKMYNCKFIVDGILAFNGIPAKNSDGVVGLYDLADTNPATAFHTNAGTGVFGEGPVVE